MSAFDYRDGQLYAEGVPIEAIAAEHGTRSRPTATWQS